MKIKTSELTDLALDWAVSAAKGLSWKLHGHIPFSTDWAQGGPIIERERIELHCWDFHSLPWEAFVWWDGEDSSAEIQAYGPTPLIAAMRCYVEFKLGDEVDVPNEILKGNTNDQNR